MPGRRSSATGLCVGLPILFREAANRQGRLLRSLSSDAFAAYIFHFPVVMLIQWALIGSGLSIPARIVLTVVGGVIATFVLCHALVLRVPGVRRVIGS